MKKLSILCLVSAIGCMGFLTSCDDSNDNAAKRQNGEKCSASSECQSDFCNANNKCEDKPAAETKKDNGETCADNAECKSNYCNDDKKCDDKPAEETKKDNGEACDDNAECKSDFCNDDKKCNDKPAEETKKDNGETCTDNAECKSDFCNDDKKCDDKPAEETKKDNGETCDDNAECKSNYCNDDKKCGTKPAAETKKDNGETCANNAECKSNYCNDDKKCSVKPAADAKENGSSCATDTNCKSGYCKKNRICSVSKTACVAITDCPLGETCNDANVCTERISDATTPCQNDVDCLSGYCALDKVCKSKLDNGSDCTSSLDCKSGNCDETTKKCAISTYPSVESFDNASTCTTSFELSCAADNYIAECQIWETGAAAYSLTKCKDNTLCVTNDRFSNCVETCTEAELGKNMQRCDKENIDEYGFSLGYYIYQCAKVGIDYVWVITAEANCGTMGSPFGSGYFCENATSADGSRTVVCGN